MPAGGGEEAAAEGRRNLAGLSLCVGGGGRGGNGRADPDEGGSSEATRKGAFVADLPPGGRSGPGLQAGEL